LKALAACHGLNQSITKQRTIYQPCQMVILREVSQPFFSAFALNRISDCTSQEFRVSLTFDQIVLCPLLDRLKSQTLVTDTTEHDNWRGGTCGMNLSYRRNAKRVGK